VILKYTPKLQFVLDESIEGGDRILSLLSKLPTAPDEEVPPTHEP
jgi:ribosome-binding factor A